MGTGLRNEGTSRMYGQVERSKALPTVESMVPFVEQGKTSSTWSYFIFAKGNTGMTQRLPTAGRQEQGGRDRKGSPAHAFMWL